MIFPSEICIFIYYQFKIISTINANYERPELITITQVIHGL